MFCYEKNQLCSLNIATICLARFDPYIFPPLTYYAKNKNKKEMLFSEAGCYACLYSMISNKALPHNLTLKPNPWHGGDDGLLAVLLRRRWRRLSSRRVRRFLSPLLQCFSLFVFFLCFGVPPFSFFFVPVLSLSVLYL